MNRINDYNEKINYQEGKIYFEPNKGYTSDLIKRLLKLGWHCSTSGVCHYLYDNENNKVCTAFSWEGLLFEAAKIMQ